MKLRLLMFFGLLTSLFVSVQAQTSSNEVVFTDADGKVLAPNAMLVLNKVRDGAFGGKEISTRLFIHNNSGKNQTVTLSCTISGIKDGNVKVCALGECSLKEEDGTYEVGSKKLSTTSRNEEISVERSFESNEKCTVKLQLTTKEAGADGGEVKKAGPVITLNITPTLQALRPHLHRTAALTMPSTSGAYCCTSNSRLCQNSLRVSIS